MQISTEAGRLYGKFDNNCNPDRQYGLMLYGFCAADRRRKMVGEAALFLSYFLLRAVLVFRAHPSGDVFERQRRRSGRDMA